MEILVKAEQIKKQFSKKIPTAKEPEIKAMAQTYIDLLMDQFYLKDGDYKMQYSYEYQEYKSYWLAVKNAC